MLLPSARPSITLAAHRLLDNRFFKTASGVKVQELAVGTGPPARDGDKVQLDYVLRRSNGYFIYSTVEGVSFQPKDIPTGPLEFQLVRHYIVCSQRISCLRQAHADSVLQASLQAF